MKQGEESMKSGRRKVLFFCLTLLALSIISMVMIPTVNRSLAVFCNELFAASENVNHYVYERIPVDGEISAVPARIVLSLCGVLWIGILGSLTGNGAIVLSGIALALGQAWLGLSLPAVLNIGLYAGLGLIMVLKRNGVHACLLFCGCVVLSALLVVVVMPGIQPSVEELSELVRDRLEPADALPMTDGATEEPEQRETRYENLKDLQEGDRPAETREDYRLVTVEEEQIAMPHWIDYLRIVLLCVLVPAVLVLPFVPFVWLNRRNRMIAEKLDRTESEDPTEASKGMFALVTGYLDAMGIGTPNCLYADRLRQKDDRISDEYIVCYESCTGIWLGTVYGGKQITQEQRAMFADLLEKTERQFYDQGDRHTRFLLKYRYCLHE